MRARGQGFTLVEVLVALVVVALALPAVVTAVMQQLDAAAYLRDRVIAQSVAENRLTELRLQARQEQRLLRGQESGVVEQLGRHWYWQARAETTEVQGFWRLTVEVRQQPDAEPLGVLVGFVGSPG